MKIEVKDRKSPVPGFNFKELTNKDAPAQLAIELEALLEPVQEPQKTRIVKRTFD